jgi:hypothetical protein
MRDRSGDRIEHALCFCTNASNAVSVSDAEPMTYADTGKIKAGAMKVPDTAAARRKRYGYARFAIIVDGEIPF